MKQEASPAGWGAVTKETNLEQPTTHCICGSKIAYEACCGLYHAGEKNALTAEALLRSRFSAFALKNQTYILETWHPSKRPPKVDFSIDEVEWKCLDIVEKKKGEDKDVKGIIEFKAYYLLDNDEYAVNELSRFRKEQGRWYYLDGVVKSIAKPGQHTKYRKKCALPLRE